MSAVVTLLSDFGVRDGFVAAMKGVILGIAPEVVLVDASHDIEPGDVEAAAFVLLQYCLLFAEGSVHLAVVDPRVGSERKALAMCAMGRYIVAPDNGLVTRVLRQAQRWRCVEISDPRYLRPEPSRTFHGRDIFAPAAAHLAAGLPLERLGPAVASPVLLALTHPVRESGEVRGRVAHVDRFGNLITDIPADWLEGAWEILVAGVGVGELKRTYSQVGEGEMLAVTGSLRTLEVASRGGSAAERLGVGRGEPVICRRAESRTSASESP